MNPPSPKKYTLLIVDDSRADARLAQLWLRKSQRIQEVCAVQSGGEALSFLRREGPFSEAPPVQLLLVDVHLPDMLGWDLIAQLRADPEWARIPVVILTGTTCDADARRARSLGVARYLAKPFDAEEFGALVGEIEQVLESSEHNT
jgi:chemotaxis family two-component system response regulator Rcp1